MDTQNVIVYVRNRIKQFLLSFSVTWTKSKGEVNSWFVGFPTVSGLGWLTTTLRKRFGFSEKETALSDRLTFLPVVHI